MIDKDQMEAMDYDGVLKENKKLLHDDLFIEIEKMDGKSWAEKSRNYWKRMFGLK